jgi:transposase-like protein
MDKREIEGKDKRCRHGETFERELIERSLQPGASVSALAQEHGINAKLLFNWRRLHLRGLAASSAAPVQPALLPVTVVPESPPAASGSTARVCCFWPSVSSEGASCGRKLLPAACRSRRRSCRCCWKASTGVCRCERTALNSRPDGPGIGLHNS